MEAPMTIPPRVQTAKNVIGSLMLRQEHSWAWTDSGSSIHTSNPVALHYTLNLNEFRMREIEKIVVIGLRGLGTVEELCANYDGQRLDTEQCDIQDAAAAQLAMALVIRDHIRTTLRNHAEVDLYVCDHDLTEDTAPALQQLEFTVLEPRQLFRLIDQNTLVYDVTMRAGELQTAVDLRMGRIQLPPAAIITHMKSLAPDGAEDVDLLEKYWLAPLMEFNPSVILPPEASQKMATKPKSGPEYNKWVYLQEQHSQNIRQAYFADSAAHYQQVVHLGPRNHNRVELVPRKSWICDPMMIMLCRKDSSPSMASQTPQQHGLLPQQQQPGYQQREDGWSGGDFEDTDGYGALPDVRYAPMPGTYGHGDAGEP